MSGEAFGNVDVDPCAVDDSAQGEYACRRNLAECHRAYRPDRRSEMYVLDCFVSVACKDRISTKYQEDKLDCKCPIPCE